MPYELYLRHYDRAGTLKHAVVEPLAARFTSSVAGAEPLVFTLGIDNEAASDVAEFDIFEVMLRNIELGISDFTRAFVGVQRHWSLDTDDDGVQVFTFTAPNEKSILGWRSVLWYANVASRSVFSAVKAETIMKTLVKYNLTSFATVANGRLREGNLSTAMSVDVTIAADGAAGNAISLGCQGTNVLNTLQKIEELGGGDFSFEWAGANTNDWTFAWHTGQLGSDKSSGADRVLFSVDNNTMLRPRLNYQSASASSGIAGGKGDDSARLMQAVTGPDYAAAFDIETMIDATQENDAAGLTFRGELALEKLRSKAALSFDVLQTAGQFYSPIAVTGRKTYKPGDLVLAEYNGSWVRKIDAVVCEWKPPAHDDAFSVSLVTREVPSGS